MKTTDLDANWRSKFTSYIGGAKFDEPGGGCSFSAVLNEERELEKANLPGKLETALLKLSVVDPTWKMPAGAMDAAREYFNAAWDASRYKDIRGVLKTPGTIMEADTHEMLVRAIQARHSVVTEDGKSLTADWVQHSPGSIKRALAEYIPTLLFDQQTKLIFPSPSYQVMASAMNRRGVKVLAVPLIQEGGHWRLDMGELTRLAQIALSRDEKLVMYVNLPHNPTGMVYTRSNWEGLINWACHYGVTLVVDEAYIDLRYRDDIVSALTMPGWEKCCIVLQSVSKGWNATGLRFGWIVAHPTVIKALRKVMDVKDSGMFGPSIVAGLWCLQHPEIAEATKGKYSLLHQKLAFGLQQAGFASVMPGAGLCQFTSAPKQASCSLACHPGGSVPVGFKDAADCAKWLRESLRISVMHAQAAGGRWLCWAVTLQSAPDCGLMTELDVIAEAVRRLKSVKFEV